MSTTTDFSKTVTIKIDRDADETVISLELEPINHIVILVPGTTDPVNTSFMYENGVHESRTINDKGTERIAEMDEPAFKGRPYSETFNLVDLEDPNIAYEEKWLSSIINSFANETYWQSYPDFIPSVHRFIDELKAKGETVYLIDKVRWSGDNNDDERRKGGQHIADLLFKTGAEFEWTDNATKAKLKDERVCLHLIGHSHGGNVMNEFTHLFAQQKPENWSIKTLVYLSTPFFNNMHKVNGNALDAECDILNAYNRYDLTQRVVADYTVKPIKELHELTSKFSALIRVISKLDLNRTLLTEGGTKKKATGMAPVGLGFGSI
ncbi:MAG: hypothetical protein P8X74_24155 [Reinekea sp.]